MLYLKKYLTEGLIQMAILLSLCGVRVDMGLEPYLAPPLARHDPGPHLAADPDAVPQPPQTAWRTARHCTPKSVDLDGFFTTRGLLAWSAPWTDYRFLIQKWKTWLVQRDTDPLPLGCTDLSLERAAAGGEREPMALPAESRAVVLREEEEEDNEQSAGFKEQQLHDVEGRREDLAHQSPGREPLLSQINHHGNPLLEMELDWQDLLAIMEPENTEVDMTQHSRATGSLQGVGCEDLNQNDNNHGRRDTEADQEVLLMDAPRQHSLLRSPALLALTPSAEWMTIVQPVFLVDEEENIANEDGLLSPLSDFLEDAAILDEMRLLDLALEDGFSPEMATRLEEEEDQGQSTIHLKDEEEEEGSDSGLSLDFSHSPASQCASEASSYSSSSTSSSSRVSAVESPFSEEEDEEGEEDSVGSEMEMEVTIKQEDLEEEEMGAVGGGYPEDFKNPFLPTFGDHKLYNGFFLENIGHDHTYNQPLSSDSSPSLGKMPTKHTKSSSRHDNAKPYHRSSSRRITESRMWSRDERRARVGKLPFSNELIVNLPVEEFNDLMANYQLSEEQLILVRDIRRRGKNKIAAQNCRKRRLDVLLGLKDNVSGLRRYHSRLLREKQEAMRNLQEMKLQLSTLYQDVFSTLRDNEGMPLDSMEHLLQFESNGSVTIASRQHGAALPRTKPSKKQRDKKK
ncbi:hypothetical protein KUCAC02_008047 [Chaenocephalus aceratus]|uniref:Uncharacterized protein n=1 Tax=Chaenocephalus aceratus TaxID=36190 RepID=A0ACB9X7A6_CHAAC|nr:hypothetical protein KUCAC02_008047 [Chaenocephalus aceratus]